MKTSALNLIIILVLVSITPSAILAQSPEPFPDCQKDPACVQLKERAAEKSKAGDLVDALRLYKLAYEIRPDPRLLYNLGRTLHKQGQGAEAAPYYQKFLDSNVQDDEPRQKAREYLTQIQHAQALLPTEPIGEAKTIISPLPSLTSSTDASPAPVPIYKKWWLWTIVSVAIIGGIAGGIAGGVLASQRLPDVTIRPFGQ